MKNPHVSDNDTSISASASERADINRLYKQTKTTTYTKFAKNSFELMRCVRVLPVRALIFEINAVFVASQLHMAWANRRNKQMRILHLFVFNILNCYLISQ